MIRLREVAAREKEAATRVQTRLLKQIGAQRGSRSSPIAGKKPASPFLPTRTQGSAHFTGSSRCVRSETYEDEEDSKDTRRSRTPKFPRIEDITDVVQERLNQAIHQFSKGIEYNEWRPTNSPLSRKIMTICFPKKFVMLSFDHYSGTSDPLLYLRQYQDKVVVYAHNDLLLYRAFPSSLKGVAYH